VPEQLVSAIVQALDRQAAKRGLVLDPEERARRLAELDLVILSIQRSEEAITSALAASGVHVPRRRSADVGAVLMVEAEVGKTVNFTRFASTGRRIGGAEDYLNLAHAKFKFVSGCPIASVARITPTATDAGRRGACQFPTGRDGEGAGRGRKASPRSISQGTNGIRKT
jgi:hypothetical protein